MSNIRINIDRPNWKQTKESSIQSALNIKNKIYHEYEQKQVINKIALKIQRRVNASNFTQLKLEKYLNILKDNKINVSDASELICNLVTICEHKNMGFNLFVDTHKTNSLKLFLNSFQSDHAYINHVKDNELEVLSKAYINYAVASVYDDYTLCKSSVQLLLPYIKYGLVNQKVSH